MEQATAVEHEINKPATPELILDQNTETLMKTTDYKMTIFELYSISSRPYLFFVRFTGLIKIALRPPDKFKFIEIEIDFFYFFLF